MERTVRRLMVLYKVKKTWEEINSANVAGHGMICNMYGLDGDAPRRSRCFCREREGTYLIC